MHIEEWVNRSDPRPPDPPFPPPLPVGDPVPRAVERIRGQENASPGRDAVDSLPVDGAAGRVHLRERFGDLAAVVLVAPQRRDPCEAGIRQAAPPKAQQRRRRTDLDKYPDVSFRDGPHPVREAHRVPDVPPPVGRRGDLPGDRYDSGEVRNHRYRRGGVFQFSGEALERVEHGIDAGGNGTRARRRGAAIRRCGARGFPSPRRPRTPPRR